MIFGVVTQLFDNLRERQRAPRHWDFAAQIVIGNRTNCGGSARCLHRGTPSTNTRFIPAHAGNTLHEAINAGHFTVHPRARGEHCRATRDRSWSTGSSPRTRGTRWRVSIEADIRRFIPAHAGNTRARPSARVNETVHPRARGEHRSLPVSGSVRIGSSPRTREHDTIYFRR